MSGPWEKYQSTPAEPADTGASEGPWSKYKAAPVPQESPSALASVGNTIKDRLLSAKATPGGLGLMTPELRKGGQYAVNRLADVEQGAIASVPTGAQFLTEGVSQALPNGGKVWEKAANLVPWLPKPKQDYMKAAAPIGSGEEGIVPEMAREVGGYLPYGALGEAKALPQATGKVAQYLGKSILGQTLAGAASGAVNGEEGNKFQSSLLGASLNIGGAGLGNAALKFFEKLRPSKLLRGTLSDEELARNLKDTKGTETALGNVIQNRLLQRVSENVLPETPLSGASQSAQRTANVIKERAEAAKPLLGYGENPALDVSEDVLSKSSPVLINQSLNKLPNNVSGAYELVMKDILGKNSTDDIAGQLQKTVEGGKAAVGAEKNANYRALNQAADDASQLVGSKKIAQKTKDYITAINESPRLAAEVPSDIKKSLELYSNPNYAETFKQTDVLRGRLGQKAKEYRQEGKEYEAGIYSGLKQGLEEDVNDAIEMSGDSGLKSLRDKAHTFYKEKYAPYKDKDIAKFIEKGGDPDTLIGSFIKTGGGQDRGRQLQKLTSKLPEDKKDLLAYGYLTKGTKGGKLDPEIIAKNYQALGDEQKKILFRDPKKIQQLDVLSKQQERLQYYKNAYDSEGNVNPSEMAKKYSELSKEQKQKFHPNKEERAQLEGLSTQYEKNKYFEKAYNNDNDLIPEKFSALYKKMSPEQKQKFYPTKEAQEKADELATFADKSQYYKGIYDSEGKINPSKLATKYKDLTPEEKLKLHPSKEERETLDSLTNLESKNKDALYNMFNPPTGQRTGIQLGLGALGTAAAVAGHSVAGLPGSAAALGALMFAGNRANKVLTSEATRTKLIEAMLKKEPKFKSTPAQRVAAQTLAQAAMNAQQGNQ